MAPKSGRAGYASSASCTRRPAGRLRRLAGRRGNWSGYAETSRASANTSATAKRFCFSSLATRQRTSSTTAQESGNRYIGRPSHIRRCRLRNASRCCSAGFARRSLICRSCSELRSRVWHHNLLACRRPPRVVGGRVVPPPWSPGTRWREIRRYAAAELSMSLRISRPT